MVNEPEAENDKKAKKATIRKLRRQEVREATKRKAEKVNKPEARNDKKAKKATKKKSRR